MSPNWGNSIFQTANELVQHELTQKKINELQDQGKKDREWWDVERASIQSKFMKELDEEPGAAGVKPTTPGVRTGSDEDAVLVEGGGPAASGSAAGQGSTKKRKGKK